MTIQLEAEQALHVNGPKMFTRRLLAGTSCKCRVNYSSTLNFQ